MRRWERRWRAKIWIAMAVLWAIIALAVGLPALISTITYDDSKQGTERTTTRSSRDDVDERVSTCTRASHRAYEVKQAVRSQLDRPDTYGNASVWRNVSTSMMDTEDDRLLVSILRASYVSDYEGGDDDREVEVVGYNFRAENLYGATVGLRAIMVFTPAPDCRLLEVLLFEGMF